MGNNRAQLPLFWPISPDSLVLASGIFAGRDPPPVGRSTAAVHRLISPCWHSDDALHGHKFGFRLLLSHRQRHMTLRTSGLGGSLARQQKRKCLDGLGR